MHSTLNSCGACDGGDAADYDGGCGSDDGGAADYDDGGGNCDGGGGLSILMSPVLACASMFTPKAYVSANGNPNTQRKGTTGDLYISKGRPVTHTFRKIEYK